MTETRNDAHLWATMVGSLKAAGLEDAETLARALVAVVRREQDPHTAHFAPGDAIPYDVIAVSDLDGAVWERESTDPASGQRDHWKMRDYDPDEHESAAAGVQLTPFLATTYGPLTAKSQRPADNSQVARTTVVPWDTVTDDKERPAWTAGQLRAAIADLDDGAPVLVHVATDDDSVIDEQIITDAGRGWVDWGDGYGREADPIFALECHWPSTTNLLIRPDRPRRPDAR